MASSGLLPCWLRFWRRRSCDVRASIRSKILPRSWSIAASVLLRWALLLAILVAIGYMTKSSAQFSRRVILTWAVVTPVPLILVSIALHESIRSFLHSPKNARLAVIAGFNDVSLALAKRVSEQP